MSRSLAELGASYAAISALLMGAIVIHGLIGAVTARGWRGAVLLLPKTALSAAVYALSFWVIVSRFLSQPSDIAAATVLGAGVGVGVLLHNRAFISIDQRQRYKALFQAYRMPTRVVQVLGETLLFTLCTVIDLPLMYNKTQRDGFRPSPRLFGGFYLFGSLSHLKLITTSVYSGDQHWDEYSGRMVGRSSWPYRSRDQRRFEVFVGLALVLRPFVLTILVGHLLGFAAARLFRLFPSGAVPTSAEALAMAATGIVVGYLAFGVGALVGVLGIPARDYIGNRVRAAQGKWPVQRPASAPLGVSSHAEYLAFVWVAITRVASFLFSFVNGLIVGAIVFHVNARENSGVELLAVFSVGLILARLVGRPLKQSREGTLVILLSVLYALGLVCLLLLPR